jgi:hypothetical protein
MNFYTILLMIIVTLYNVGSRAAIKGDDVDNLISIKNLSSDGSQVTIEKALNLKTLRKTQRNKRGNMPKESLGISKDL